MRARQRCDRPPSDAAGMSTEQLRLYLRWCIGVAKVGHYALASVPVYQLALFLRTFPNATWTFYEYEALYQSSLTAREIKQRLAARFGTQIANASADNPPARDVCDFNGIGRARNGEQAAQRIRKAHFEHDSADGYREARRLLAPWYDALTALVRQFIEEHPHSAAMLT